MSVLSINGRESTTASYCHDHPPQYDAYQPSEDILTSVLENDKTRRNIRIRLDNIGAEMLNKIQKRQTRELPDCPDYISAAEFFQDIGRLTTEMGQLLTVLANIAKESAVKHTDLCTVMSRLSENEFNRVYDSSKRDLNQRMQPGLAQDRTNGGYCHDRDIGHESQRSLTTTQVESAGNSSTSDFSFSRDRFFALSAEVDRINEEPDQRLPSYDTANASKMNDNATADAAKPRVGFWTSLKKSLTAQLGFNRNVD
jgi:hypothetical protein